MPWHLSNKAAGCSGWAVVKDDDGKVVGCHPTKDKALAQLAALNANVKEKQMVMEKHVGRPPRENLVRAMSPGMEYELRDASDGKPKMVGHFAVFNEWTEVNSLWEGHFLEKNAPGAFEKTIDRNRDRIKSTFNHGSDPDLGDKVLGTIADMHEDERGVAYEVDLFPSVPPLIMDGLRAGAYGSSYRFRVLREEWTQDPDPSDYNPNGLPERIVNEAEVAEFGPVTYPQYDGATAGVRSLTDEYLFGELTSDPKRLADIIDYRRGLTLADIPTTDKSKDDKPPKAESKAKPDETKEEDMAVDIDRFNTLELLAARDGEIDERFRYLNAEYAGKEFPPEVQTEWEELEDEQAAIAKRAEHLRKRDEKIAHNGSKPERTEDADGAVRTTPVDRGLTRTPENIYDVDAYRKATSSPDQEVRLLSDGVKRSIETTDIPIASDEDEGRAKALRTFTRLQKKDGALARYLLAVGSPTYRRAFGKFAQSAPAMAFFAPDEAAKVQEAQGYAERAFSLGSTGLPVPYQLDVTVIPTSNFSVNPFRAISRVVQTTVNEWRGTTSAGITAQYETEAAEAPDDTPTLAQPAITANRADAFVPLSFEAGQDWPELEAEMGREVADAKDDLEATKFTLGTGTNEPQGIIVGATTLVITTTTAAFVIADTYKLEEAVPPRFRPRASVIANRFILNKVRQFDTSGGSGVWLDVPGLQQGLGNQVPTPGQVARGVLGYPTYEDSAMDAALTTGSEIIVMGDFRYYVIVDRIGMSADLIPHLVGTNHRPTGQRGLYFFWRNGAEVISAGAFRVLQT